MQRKLTVAQLNSYIEGVFEDEQVLHNVIVTGEIYDMRTYRYKTFFSLRDGEYALQCLSFVPVKDINEGDKVEVTGTVSFYKKSGKVTFLTEEVKLSGEGEMLARLKALKEKLSLEGVFSNRPPLPERVNKIAVISSESGAVIHDILSVVRKKNPLTSVMLYDCRVQGLESAKSIKKAVENINDCGFGCDVIIIARGGGSSSDLEVFNDEELARAVSKSVIPVISAIGHEVDYTLCDLAASERAGTPSIAADRAVTPIGDILNEILSYINRIWLAVSDKYKEKQNGVIVRSNRLVRQTETILSSCESKINSLIRKIESGTDRLLGDDEKTLVRLSAALDRLSPLKVLSQGYAKVLKGGEEIVSSASLKSGDDIDVVFFDGRKSAEVK